MTSTVRLLAQTNDAVPSATVSASSVLPAARSVYPQRTERSGNGTVVLIGDYEGENDTEIEIEIRPSAGAAVTVTAPTFSGAGNGTMEDVAADPGSDAQTVTATLTDLGTATTAAQVAIYANLLLRAKTAGSAGNAITLTVTPDLTLSAAPVGALSFAIAHDTAEWSDPRGQFSAAPLNPDGTIPASAPRLVFGRNLAQVYRHCRRWDGERWQYGISPPAITDYAEGDLVHTVTGDYTVTVSDGVTTETYPGVVTLYDFLLALNASALIEPVGVVANDKKPAGIAAIDFPIRTQSYLLAVSHSSPGMPDLQNVAITDDAPTETVTLRCAKNTPLGAETWSVLSRVAGELPPATTGVPYDGEFLDFTIPIVRPAVIPTQGTITITKQEFAGGESDPPAIPAICLDRPRLGIKASAKTLKLVYKRRPLADCNCNDAAVTGGPDPDCLGQDAAEGGLVGTLPAGYQSRLEDLYDWRRGFIEANTGIDADSGTLTTVFNDVELADQVTRIFADCLAELFTDSETPDSDALTQWDGELTAMTAELLQLYGMVGEPALSSTVLRFSPGTQYRPSDTILPQVAYRNGHQYKINPPTVMTGDPPAPLVFEAFASDVNVTTWPVNGEGLAVVGWGYETYGGAPTMEVTAWLMDVGTGTDIDNSITADPVVWRRAVDQFVRRYAAQMDLVRVKAGIVPKSDASGAGSPCWRDPGDAYWWEFEDAPYLPVFNNVYYHSARMACSDDANAVTSGQEQPTPTPTYEFGFGLRVGCPERLLVGDSITLVIGDVAGGYPYNIGDTYSIPIVGGGPLAFAGGVTGTDTLTWTVQSDVQGVLDDYALDLSEDPYSDGGLGFAIHRGTLPFALGDAFSFAVETGGLFRWRRDGGSWSADTAIVDTVALVDGLSAAFTQGARPSFVVGDGYAWDVLQPHSPAHCQTAHGETWRWANDAATLTLTWASDQTISAVGLLRHGLAAPATVTITLKNALGATLATVAPTVAAGPLVAMLTPALTTVRSVEIALADAEGMALGWVYVGQPLATTHQPDRCVLRRGWALERGGGVNPGAARLGSGGGGEIVWSHLLQAEFDALWTLIGACKTDADAPLVLVPHHRHPAEAVLCRIGADELEITDVLEFQPNDPAHRRLGLTLPLSPVWQ
ncbi:MAG: hypothetical protein P9F75_07260 [Candidatus Contendobacter sp.]|nr:hypothetical protein [Candidatus Contendobacter sp.]